MSEKANNGYTGVDGRVAGELYRDKMVDGQVISPSPSSQR